MEVPLLGVLVCQPGLLEQVVLDIGRGELAVPTEVHSDELSESGGVIVPHGLGVTVRLKDGVTHDNLVLNAHLLLPISLSGGSTNGGKVLDDLLRVLGLSRTGLSRNQDGLVLPVLQHVRVGVVSNGEDVRRHLVLLLATVVGDHSVGVDGEPLVRVDSHTEKSRVGLGRRR